MADENLDTNLENSESGTAGEQHKFTEIEQKALEQGWVPEEDFNGEPEKWVDAGEFLRRGELFKKIDQQNKKIRQQDDLLQDLKKHYESVKETEFKRALEELRKEKKEALLEGDPDAVLEVDEKIESLREKRREELIEEQTKAAQAQTGENHPVFVAWKEKNPWYGSSLAMKGWADGLGAELAADGKTPAQVLEIISQKVKEEFPNKFRNPNRDKPDGASAPGSARGGSKSQEKLELTEIEQQIMNKFVRSGVMTKEQYIADLRKQRG